MQDAMESSHHLHNRIIDTLRVSISSSVVFCVTREPSASSPMVGTQAEADDLSDLQPEEAYTLWAAFAPSPTVRGVPARARDESDIMAHGSVPVRLGRLATEHAQVLVQCLQRDGQVFGVVGVARHADEPAFASLDRDRLRAIGDAFSDLVALRHECDELRRKELVRQSMPGFRRHLLGGRANDEARGLDFHNV